MLSNLTGPSSTSSIFQHDAHACASGASNMAGEEKPQCESTTMRRASQGRVWENRGFKMERPIFVVVCGVWPTSGTFPRLGPATQVHLSLGHLHVGSTCPVTTVEANIQSTPSRCKRAKGDFAGTRTAASTNRLHSARCESRSKHTLNKGWRKERAGLCFFLQACVEVVRV